VSEPDSKLTEEHRRKLLAVQGYCELGMIQDALDELANLSVKEQQLPTTVELRLIVLMQAHRWKDALASARRLIHIAPEKTTGYIHAAYCLHEIGNTEAARVLLIEGPESLRSEPVFYYNLACYECVLGHHEEDRRHLDRSVQLDKKFRDYAKTDPDLAPLWEP